jgi:hypothetical protein
LTVRENRAPREIFGPYKRGEIIGHCRKLPREQLQYLHYPRNIVSVIRKEYGMCETYDTRITWSRILLEKLIVPQVVEKLTAFYETRRFIIVQRKPNLMQNLFLVYFFSLYMFRAYLGPSSGGTTVCIQQSVLVILFR